MMRNPLAAAILSAVVRSTLAIAVHIFLQVGRRCPGLSLFNHDAIIADIHPVTLLLSRAIISMVGFAIPSLLPISSHLALNCMVVRYTSLKSG